MKLRVSTVDNEAKERYYELKTKLFEIIMKREKN